jgi:integrase
MRRLIRAKLGCPRQAKGMTRAHLKKCLAVQPDSLWGLCHRALLSLGFDLLTRRSELVALMTDDIELRNGGTMRVIIRLGKAYPFGVRRIGPTSRRSAQLVGEWVAWRGEDIGPLFCGIYRGKAINRSLETTKVKLIFKEPIAAAGLFPKRQRRSPATRSGWARCWNYCAQVFGNRPFFGAISQVCGTQCVRNAVVEPTGADAVPLFSGTPTSVAVG